MPVPRWLRAVLTRHAIPFEEHHHPPVFGASHLAHAEHFPGYRVAKTVFLSDHGRPVGVVLPAPARVDLGRVKELLGGEDLRFAYEAEIAGWFKGCRPGSVPPLRLRTDLTLLMDRSLAHLGPMLFAAGTPDAAVAVRFRDWYRAVRPGIGCFTARPEGKARHRQPAPVLVVEDESATNRLLCDLLEQGGLACQGVVEGERALALASEVRPSAILLDLMLPDMSGIEVYERLRKDGPLKRIPVIVLSALDDAESRRRARELGAEAYLTKPFLPEDLMDELADVFGA